MPDHDHLAACNAIHRILHDVAGTAPEYSAALDYWHAEHGCPYDHSRHPDAAWEQRWHANYGTGTELDELHPARPYIDPFADPA